MEQRQNTLSAPLRAERRTIAPAPPMGATPPVGAVPATARGLLRSTVLAAGTAAALTLCFWLPAEYGIDPTGVGALTGLTEMGQIKQQLAAEAAADAQASAAPSGAAVPLEILQRLDRIDAQLAAISAVMGAPVALSPDSAEPALPEAPQVGPQNLWRDEVSYTLNPGEGIEVKLAMQAGAVARFEWTANGGVVNFDLHGDGGGQKISYEAARAVPQASGELVAAFTGNHGWFWRNRTTAPVTITLRTGGDYAQLISP